MELKELENLRILARVGITDEELKDLQKDMAAILEYVSRIQNVERRDSMGESRGRNVFREDKESHEAGLHTEVLLQSAPKRDGDYIKVKKIL